MTIATPLATESSARGFRRSRRVPKRPTAMRLVFVAMGGTGSTFVNDFMPRLEEVLGGMPACISAISVDADLSSKSRYAKFVELRMMKYPEVTETVDELERRGMLRNGNVIRNYISLTAQELMRSPAVHGSKMPRTVLPALVLRDPLRQLQQYLIEATSEELVAEARAEFEVDASSVYVVWVGGMCGGIASGALVPTALALHSTLPNATHLALLFQTKYDLTPSEYERSLCNFGRAALEVAHVQNLRAGVEQSIAFANDDEVRVAEPLFRQIFLHEQKDRDAGEPGANRMIAGAAESFVRILTDDNLRRMVFSIALQNEIPYDGEEGS